MKRRVERLKIRQPIMAERRDEAHLPHRPNVLCGWKYHVPARVAAHYFGEHLRNAFVGAIVYPYAELALETGDRVRCDVIGPVVDIQPRDAAAASRCSRHAHQEDTAVHAERNLSENRTIAPSATMTTVETARLYLRPWSDDDLEHLLGLYSAAARLPVYARGGSRYPTDSQPGRRRPLRPKATHDG